MDFVGPRGPVAVVDHANDGARLQAYTMRQFRERWQAEAAHEMQRGGAGNSGNKRAHAAADSGALLVNDAAAAGRRVLRAGDFVELISDAAPPVPDTAQPAGQTTGPARPRMVLHHAGEDPEPMSSDGDERGASRSAAYEAYYATQMICSPEDWRRSMAAFRRPMPLCFRCSVAVPSHSLLLRALGALPGAELSAVPWAPHAWTLRLAGDGTNEAEVVAAAEARRLIQAAAAIGELHGQEAVAMIPALALRPSHTHAVLDLCAAPGGKSVQLLDMMTASSVAADVEEAAAKATSTAARSETTTQAAASGLLVVNDDGWQRQERTVRRVVSCASSVPMLATVGDARHFLLQRAAATEAPTSSDSTATDTSSPLLFDRVLCDVPCGGDGTIRKSPSKLTRWSVHLGLRVHRTQLAILTNGLAQLAVGGTLAYSTCALDPLQGEAVVRAALAADPTLRLVPPAEALAPPTSSSLQYVPGVRTWRVPDPEYEVNRRMYSRWEEVPAALRIQPGHRSEVDGANNAPSLLSESMFPQSDTGGHGDGGGVDGARVNLSNCMRLLPIHGDECGGFFVAVLQRSAPPPVSQAAATVALHPCVQRAPLPMAAELVELFGIDEDSAMLPLDRLVQLIGAPRDGSAPPTDDGMAGGSIMLSLGSPLLPQLMTPIAARSSGDGGPAPATPWPLAAGQPIFARIPPAVSWWPPEAPWRVCQPSAALVSAVASRRVLRTHTARAAMQLLSTRTTALTTLDELAADGALSGLGEARSKSAAVVLVLSSAACPEQPLAVSGLLDLASGLILLAPDDLIDRYKALVESDAAQSINPYG